MTRVLVFEGPKATRRFQLVWTALLNAGDGKGDRSPAVIRTEARLQALFEGISDPASNGTTGNGAGEAWLRDLRDGSSTVTLGQDEFDLLQQYTEKTAWHPRVSQDVVDTWDWLSAAEKRD